MTDEETVVTEEVEAESEEVVEEESVTEEVADEPTELSDEDEKRVDAWLKKRGFAALHTSHPKFQEALKVLNGKQEEVEAEDGEELVLKKDLAKAQKDGVTEAEQRMTRRYEALDNVTAILDKHKELPPESRRRIIAQFRTLPVETIEAQISGGMVEREAKAELYDLMEKGVVQSKTKKIPGAAPTGGEPKSIGLRAKLSPEQLKNLEHCENAYTEGKKWSDEQIAEAFGIEVKA